MINTVTSKDKVVVNVHGNDWDEIAKVNHNGDFPVCMIDRDKVGAAVDVPENFELTRWQSKLWTSQSRDPVVGGTPDNAAVFMAQSACAVFEPKDPVESALEGLLEELRKDSKKVPKARSQNSHENLLVISIRDLHHGLTLEPDLDGSVGGSWNMDKAEELYLASLNKIISDSKLHGFERILIPVGDDLNHTDSHRQTTTRGTFMPDAAPYHIALRRSIALITKAAEHAATFAPVDLITVPGNHDRETNNALGLILEATFKNNKMVSVDPSPQPYKLYRYGVTLLGLDHGREIKHNRYATLMSEMATKEDWNETVFREWLVGDSHRETFTDDQHGVIVRWCPSLAPPNAWASRKGLTATRRALGLLYSKHAGLEAQFYATVSADGETIL